LVAAIALAASVVPAAGAKLQTAAPRVLAICADDIGLVAGAADTATALGAAGRLTAASCVTTGALWPSEAKRIAGVELGLHFNLTEGTPLSPDLAAHWPVLPGLARLLMLAHLRRLPKAAIAAEWQAQVHAFCDAIGREPDFVDGHQHVHHLPGVRDVVVSGVSAWKRVPAMRNTGHVVGPGAGFKGRVIETSGGRALERELVARGLRHNRVLLGAYDFESAYAPLVAAWLAAAPAEGGLMFCHPCRAAPTGASTGDAIAVARVREAAWLAGQGFAEQLAAANVTPGSAWALRSSSGG